MSLATLSTHPFSATVTELRERLLAHRIYQIVDDQAELRAYMHSYVFAVWEFQCLMKALQRELTCVTVPWLPKVDPVARRMINEIVMDEECDITADGRTLSQFEMYLEAMHDCGANTVAIDRFLKEIRASHSWIAALQRAEVPACAADFVTTSMTIATTQPIHAVAASFAYGCEDVIPEMFQQFVDRLAEDDEVIWGKTRDYLSRHIKADGDTHGSIARELVAKLCGSDRQKWAEAEVAAVESLRARIKLWDRLAEEVSLV